MTEPIKVPELMEFLKEKTGYVSLNGNKSEIITLCPWCETERFHTHVNHGHCYINVHDLCVNCFRCENGRTYLPKLIKKFGQKVNSFLEDGVILRNWDKQIKLRKSKKQFDIIEYVLDDDKEEIVNYDQKRDYILDRLGENTQIENIPGLFFSLKKFVKDNRIKLQPNVLKILNFLDEDFVGFVSSRGSCAVLRNTNKKSDFRYYKLQITENNFFKDFYGIRTGKTELDNKIVLAEGVFDIIVPYRTEIFSDLKLNSCLWASCLGNGYKNILLSTLDYCKITRADFVILSDRDVQESYYEFISKSSYVRSLEVYWNKHSKDFGKLPIEIVKKKFK